MKFIEPAFPVKTAERIIFRGISARDYFAAKAMQGYISIGTESLSNRANIAQMSYDMADAMLAERSKQ